MALSEEAHRKVMEVESLVLREGALDNKTRALIALAGALVAGCGHCHRQLLIMAEELGASRAEVEETRLIARRMRRRCWVEVGLYDLN